MPSPPRSPSTRAPAWVSPTGSPRCSRTRKPCCCSTTASTSWNRSPGWWRSLLARCPNVTVLATSRERLRVGGERLCTVPPLATNDRRCAGGRAVRRTGPSRRAGLRSRARRVGARHRDRAPPRRAPAGHRAGSRAPAHTRRRRGGDRARPTVRAAVSGFPHVDAARVVARGGVVVVRAARRRAAPDVRRPVRVRRLVHGRGRGRDLRRPDGPTSPPPSTSWSSVRS